VRSYWKAFRIDDEQKPEAITSKSITKAEDTKMNEVGIDVSKGNSMITVRQPLDKIIVKPYEILHTVIELKKLAELLRSLNGETRVIMENTGVYHLPIADYLHKAGIFVSVVNAKMIHGYDKDPLRKVKTDKADAKKIAEYGLAKWSKVRRYEPDNANRRQLLIYNRQYCHYSKTQTMHKNNLDALLEQVFPQIKTAFSKSYRADRHEKWVDFVGDFWHCECACSLSEAKFYEKFKKWCNKKGYHYRKSQAAKIYEISKKYAAVLPKDEFTETLIKSATAQINSIAETQAAVLRKMKELAKSMPEWEAVIEMSCVGENLAAQLIAEIGDINRFDSKKSLTGFAGVDSATHQSGTVNRQGEPVTKSGSPHLRRALFLILFNMLRAKPDDDIYHFILKKKSEKKKFLVYMVAGFTKFLRVYYGRVKEHLSKSAPALSCQ
jgi:transposase